MPPPAAEKSVLVAHDSTSAGDYGAIYMIAFGPLAIVNMLTLLVCAKHGG